MSQLAIDLPLSMVSGTLVQKGLVANGVKVNQYSQASVQAATLATWATLRKAGKFVGNQIS